MSVSTIIIKPFIVKKPNKRIPKVMHQKLSYASTGKSGLFLNYDF